MADTLSQRIHRLARAHFAPADIAQFLQISEPAVLASLADLTVDGASQEQRILTLVLAGHHPDEVATWLGVSVPTVMTALQDLTIPTPTAVVPFGGAIVSAPPYAL